MEFGGKVTWRIRIRRKGLGWIDQIHHMCLWNYQSINKRRTLSMYTVLWLNISRMFWSKLRWQKTKIWEIKQLCKCWHFSVYEYRTKRTLCDFSFSAMFHGIHLFAKIHEDENPYSYEQEDLLDLVYSWISFIV